MATLNIEIPAATADAWARLDPVRRRHIESALVAQVAQLLASASQESVSEARVPRHRPSPLLANRGARLLGDDVAPAFAPEEWGGLFQADE